jgi:hypothetical protein
MILYLLFPIFSLFSTVQESSFHLNKFISCEASSILIDNIGNIYTIGTYEIKKYNENGDLQYTYSDKSKGDIAFVDASNPLNVLVFYRDFRQLIFLDNTLSPMGDAFFLAEHELDQVSFACTSRDNGIWLFDQQKSQLLRMDKNFEIIQQSGHINQLLGMQIYPNYMMEYNNQLYINDPEIGILVFDIYGAYYKTIPFKQLKSFQIAGDRLYYFSDAILKSYDMKTFEEQSIILPEPGAIGLKIEGSKVVLLTNDHMTIYTLLNP